VVYTVPFVRPHFPSPALISQDFERIVTSNWFTNFGPHEREFATAISEYVGSATVATTFSNATTALMAAIQAIVGRGDGTKRILVPSFTFAAGPEAIVWAGYTPWFIDIDPDSLQPSLTEAESALGAGTNPVSAILLCNTFGIGNPEIEAWEALASAADIPLIIDSAAGFGSRYPDGRLVGTAGTAEIFSFHATKPFAIGEGGAVVSRDAALDAKLHSFQNFGFAPTGGAVTLGLNGKLQEINAAIGLRQLKIIDDAIASRKSTLAHYSAALPEAVFTFPLGIAESSLCFASVLVDSGARRDRLLAKLISEGIEARAYYSPPVDQQPFFRSMPVYGELPVTRNVTGRILSVPLHPYMREEDVALVIRALTASAE
jgi:dTDP-4-amino-4,6-dideoxygalactose transaminase